MSYNPDPWALENNLHHLIAYRTQEEWDDENLSRGPGDPDTVGHYPGQLPDSTMDTPLLTISALDIDLSEVPF